MVIKLLFLTNILFRKSIR